MGNDARAPPRDAVRSGTGRISTSYDWASTTPSIAVIETVAVARDEEPVNLETLNDVVDTDALDAVLSRGTPPRDESRVRVSFSYARCEVTVRSDGGVTVDPLSDPV